LPRVRRRNLLAFLLSAVLALAWGPAVHASGGPFETAMESAAAARGVPLPLVQAVAYVDSRWEPIKTPADNGGYGPMDVLPAQLDAGVSLTGHSRSAIMSDAGANLDAGAALLARAHTGGDDLASWQPAVSAVQGARVATEVFDTLRGGAARTTTGGEEIRLAPQALPVSPAAQAGLAGSDYPPAVWVPASSSNYSVANRPHDYGVDMIIIHDTEGSYGSAIQEFQDGATQASAHYVVSDAGQITQMVAEKDVAWHAGNWDYNLRAIGIEHEGFAWSPGWYTSAMYQASAQLAASICSRYGVPMDRSHVIGHYQVPDPDHPGQFGGSGHHSDPGPYWDWNYYMGLAVSDANALPSPPHLTADPVAVDTDGTATVSWQPAQSCHDPITGYTVTEHPGNAVQRLPATATSATFAGLQAGAGYTFTVTVANSEGRDTRNTNSIPWTLQVPLGGPAASGPATASWSRDRMDVFYQGAGGQLTHLWSEGYPWRGPESLGGVLTSAPAAVSWGPSRIDVFARGQDQGLWHKAWNGFAWSAWQPLGGVLTSAPTVSSWGNNRLDVFARGQDNGLWHLSFDGYGWSGWSPLGGTLTTAPTAVSWDVNRIDIFARGANQHLSHLWWAGAWSGWQDLGGTLASAPAATSWRPSRLDVLTLSAAGGFQHLAWTGGAWTAWKDVGAGQWKGDPAAVSRGAQSIDIAVLAPDLTIGQLQFSTP
jgi:hypothetical protein